MEKLSNTDHFKERKSIILKGFDPVSSGGFTQVPNFILSKKDLTIGARVAYAVLLSYAWHNNQVFPGQTRMARDMGIKERMLRNYLSELKSSGLVKVRRRGLGKTNIYELSCKVEKKC